MKNALAVSPLIWAVMAVSAAVYVGWGLAPTSAVYAGILTPHVMLAVAAIIKLAFLLSGVLASFACRDRLERGNPARPAWTLLSIGLLASFVGQLSFAPFQIVEGVTPFPSVGDLYFVLSYPFFIAAFLAFLRAYREAGLPLGSATERGGIVAGVALLALLVAVPILTPVVTTEGALLDRLLTVVYPVLDLVLLVPLALLLRVALRLRGSHVGVVWGLLLGGFVFLCLGDVLFAYFAALGKQHLDPFVHGTYILAYGLVACGALRQLRLLSS